MKKLSIIHLYNKRRYKVVMAIYLSAVDAGCVTLEPCEVATGIGIKKVRLGRLAYVECNVVEPAKYGICTSVTFNRPSLTVRSSGTEYVE